MAQTTSTPMHGLPGIELRETCVHVPPDAPLPPLPARECTRHHEAACGATLVLSIVVGLVGFTHGVALRAGRLPPGAWWAFLVAIYAEAAVALGCLGGLLLGDAGEVTRSDPAATAPRPAEVDARLRDGRPLDDLRNPEEPGTGRTYCVRCFVWRPPRGASGAPHHCRVCQRCVLHFDHHCGVYGRCIAGDGVRNGNLRYFFTIIVMGYAGFFTMLATCVAGLAFRWAATADEAGSGG